MNTSPPVSTAVPYSLFWSPMVPVSRHEPVPGSNRVTVPEPLLAIGRDGCVGPGPANDRGGGQSGTVRPVTDTAGAGPGDPAVPMIQQHQVPADTANRQPVTGITPDRDHSRVGLTATNPVRDPVGVVGQPQGTVGIDRGRTGRTGQRNRFVEGGQGERVNGTGRPRIGGVGQTPSGSTAKPTGDDSRSGPKNDTGSVACCRAPSIRDTPPVRSLTTNASLPI